MGETTYDPHGVPSGEGEDVGAGDDAGAGGLEVGLDVVDEVVAEDAAVLRRRLLRVGTVQQQRRITPLTTHPCIVPPKR